ncbi:unnamed protein product [Prorocentrum cordatum]|uniref:Eukaryotic translation initiation factor 2A n=1 Tax=Prorocentrum cordatum TaxID=2364126 RepID=A0ABN9WJ06_9DINO|nr:unnamed protein product [Polarella glacialis]
MDVVSGSMVRQVGHDGEDVRLAWSPVSCQLATVEARTSRVQRVHVTDPQSGVAVMRLDVRLQDGSDSRGWTGELVSWSPTGRHLVVVWSVDGVSCREQVRIVGVHGGALRQDVEVNDHVRMLAWRP